MGYEFEIGEIGESEIQLKINFKISPVPHRHLYVDGSSVLCRVFALPLRVHYCLPLLVVDLPASAVIGGSGVGGGGGGECVCHETVTIKHHPAWTWNGRAGV